MRTLFGVTWTFSEYTRSTSTAAPHNAPLIRGWFGERSPHPPHEPLSELTYHTKQLFLGNVPRVEQAFVARGEVGARVSGGTGAGTLRIR